MVSPLQPARPPLPRVHACQEAPPPPPNLQRCDVMLLCQGDSSEVTGSHGGQQIYPLPKQGKQGRKQGKGQRIVQRLEQTSTSPSPVQSKQGLTSPQPEAVQSLPQKGPARKGTARGPGSQISIPRLHLGMPAINSTGKSHLLAVSWGVPAGTAPPAPCPAGGGMLQHPLVAPLTMICVTVEGPHASSPRGAYGQVALAPLHLLCGTAATGRSWDRGRATGSQHCTGTHQVQAQVAESPQRAGLSPRGGESHPPSSPPQALWLWGPQPPASTAGSAARASKAMKAASARCPAAFPILSQGTTFLPVPSTRTAGLGKRVQLRNIPSPMGRVLLHTKGLHWGSPHPCRSDRPGFRPLNGATTQESPVVSLEFLIAKLKPKWAESGTRTNKATKSQRANTQAGSHERLSEICIPVITIKSATWQD